MIKIDSRFISLLLKDADKKYKFQSDPSRFFTLTCLFFILQPMILLSQNTATVSGNWNVCSTWGNTAYIYRNTTDTKTINNGITVTANENWSTGALQLNGTGAVNLSGSTLLDFTTDQGDGTSCCGAYIASGVWKNFMCHNLGANTDADPLTPSADIHGAKYQGGAYSYISGRYYSQAEDQANSGTISGWINGTTLVPWSASSHPCPSGYRVPTISEWQGVVANNTISRIGTWTDGPSNYSSGIYFGATLFLPAAGSRNSIDGALSFRGNNGSYWSYTQLNSDADFKLNFNSTNVETNIAAGRRFGYPVRCISP